MLSQLSFRWSDYTASDHVLYMSFSSMRLHLHTVALSGVTKVKQKLEA